MLGTAFDVLLSERAITVAVQSGSVSVAVNATGTVTLGPGQRAIIGRSNGTVSINAIGKAGIAAWRRGRLVVEGVPIADVVEELSRYHSGVFLLDDPALGARRVTGVFDLHHPDAALRAVLKPYGARILQITPYLLLVDGS